MLAAPETYRNSFFEGLKPDPILTVSEWADKHRTLTRVTSAEPGPWRTDRTPYLREIMDNLSVTSPYTEIVFMKGAQIGGTEIGNNWLGYIIDHAPGPTMSVMPTKETAKKNSKIRIQPLIDSSKRLSSKVTEAKGRESGNTILQKDFPGGTLVMAGANSPADLRSIPIRNLFFDEEDGYPADVGGEGDPVELAKKRTDTFASKKKIFHCSTPLIEGLSLIEANFFLTDQRRYYVPCPSCSHMQWLQWQQIKWDKGKPETVHYECEGCAYKIKNWQKTTMLAKGEWRATSVSKNKKLIGYHLSGLYSPVGWLDWEDCATQWESAHDLKSDKTQKLKTFINTVLGETWKDKGEAPEWKNLYNRRDSYEINSLPKGVCFLTAGVDVQKDRIEVEIVGWGRNKKSHSIDYRVFDGDTSSIDSHPWQCVQALLGEVWSAPNEVDVMISRMAVDSGYNTQTVYSFVRAMKTPRVIAIKGGPESQSIMVSAGKQVDVKQGNRKIRRGVKMFMVGVSILKQELYGWLKLETPETDAPDPYGYCRFPQYDEEHFKRLTSESLETKWVKGRKRYEWVVTLPSGRNEQLDCRIYARAAACLFGMDRFKEAKWSSLESEVGIVSPRQSRENVQKSKKNRPKVKIRRRKAIFMRD